MSHAIIWDYNGTLLDDVSISYEILNILLTRHGFARVKSIEIYKEIFGFPIIEYYKRAGFDFTRVSYSQLAEEYMEINKQMVKTCPLHTGAKEVLRYIHSRNIKQIVLSACEQVALDTQLKALGIAHYFDEIIGTKNVLGEGKLHMGLAWQAKCGITSAVMCGDTLHDLEVAKALGAKCVLLSAGHHSKSILNSTGEIVIDQLGELINYI